MSAPLPIIDQATCQGCGDCAAACPTGALEIVAQKAQIARPDDCAYCGDCELLCPKGAIQLPLEIVFSTSISPEEG